MASFNYMNNSAPFWDFIASLEQQGNSHPFFNQDRQDRGSESEHGEARGIPPPNFDPFSWGQQFFGGPGGLPHRGPPPPPGPHGPPPPPGPHGPPPHHDHHHHHNDEDHKHGEKHDNDSNKDNDNDNGEGPSGSGSDSEGGRHCGRRGRCGGRRGRHGFGGRGGRGGFGPHHGGPGHHGPPGHGPHGHRHSGPWGRSPWGPRGRGHPWADRGAPAPFDPSSFLAPLFAAFTAQHPSSIDLAPNPNDTDDHVPDADIFDTPSAYVIHLSLPGARKEDVGVNWDAERSELCVAGVIYRPGDEELLKTLAMGERKVGAFERKIRLGSRANPARVDAEGITAKLEDGVLRVEVRKEEEGFVEVRKVDVE